MINKSAEVTQQLLLSSRSTISHSSWYWENITRCRAKTPHEITEMQNVPLSAIVSLSKTLNPQMLRVTVPITNDYKSLQIRVSAKCHFFISTTTTITADTTL